MSESIKGKVYLILIIILVIAIAAMLILGLGRDDRSEATPAPVITPQPAAEVIIREVDKIVEVEKTITAGIIQDGLNDMGVLITQEYYFTDVISYSSVKKFLKTDISLGFTESSYLASYSGTVTAGTDFGAIKIDKDDDSRTITVHIPACEVQSIDIDYDSFVLYSEKEGLGNPISIADFNTSLSLLEQSASEKAVEKGLLTRGDENARNVIRGFIAGLVDCSEYTLIFD